MKISSTRSVDLPAGAVGGAGVDDVDDGGPFGGADRGALGCGDVCANPADIGQPANPTVAIAVNTQPLTGRFTGIR